MANRRTRTAWLALALVTAATAGLAADTLFLRNGDRVQGQLVAIRNGEVEFREQRGFGARTIRMDLRDVRRIEFDEIDVVDSRGRGDESGRRGAIDGPRPGMRERQVTVSADVPWVDTGLSVSDGQRVYFKASGQVTWGKGRRDGPDGERNSPNNPARPIPNRPAASLIGKVGDRGIDPFFIGGAQGAFQIRGNGRLFLGINDEYLRDNSGNFRVTIYY